MPCVVFRGSDVIFDGDPVVFYGPCLPDVPIPDHGFTLKVNGVDYVLPLFNGEQLRNLHLADAAFDLQVASGTFVVPGAPGWVAGDRLAFYADNADGTFIGNYFCTDRGQKRQSVETGAIETAYTIIDVNRLFIGWRQVGVSPAGDPTLFPTGMASEWVITIGNELPAGTDVTTWVDADTTVMLNKVYNSDGASDMAGDLISYTSKTLYLNAVDDASYEYHFHDLDIGPVSGIVISDDVADLFDANTFSPVGASVTWSATDLKTVVEISNNEPATVVGGDLTHAGPHSVGGLQWDFQGSYGVDQDGLIRIAETLLDGGADERPTYACTIGPLTGAQVAALRAGFVTAVTSEAMDLSHSGQYVRSRGLTVWVDELGNPVPGLWNVSLEFAWPQRQPTAVVGYGGQGGYSGLLNDPFNFADHFTTYYGDVWPPVGTQATAVTQLQGTNGQAVTRAGVQTLITLEQFLDEAETMPCNDFSLTGVGQAPIPGAETISGGTDRVGQLVYDISHDVDTGCVKMRVVATFA